jgi:hypothetical protein
VILVAHGNEAIRVMYAENQKTMAGYDVVPVELIEAGDKGGRGPADGGRRFDQPDRPG